jgi:transcriptional regulator with XRE-family HTH domain
MGKTLTHREGQWVKYLMALKHLTQADIADSARCTESMVSQIIHGRKVSANVSMALVKALGFTTLDELLDSCCNNGGAT